MKKSNTLIILVFLLITSCSSEKKIKGSFVSLNVKAIEQKSIIPEKVAIYYEKQPPKKVQEIGFVEATAVGQNVGVSDLLPELQRQASFMGANGVYKINVQRFNFETEAITANGIAFEEENKN
jgi:hypothetical protein